MQQSLDEVIISADRTTEESLKEEMENIAAMGLTIHLQIPVLELKEAPQRILSQFGKLHMITYANKVAPFGQLMLKRLLDIVGALVGTVILVILTIVLTPIISWILPGRSSSPRREWGGTDVFSGCTNSVPCTLMRRSARRSSWLRMR